MSTRRIVSAFLFLAASVPHKRVRLTKFVVLDVALCVYAVDLLVAVLRCQPGIRLAPCECAICYTWCPWPQRQQDIVGVFEDQTSCHTILYTSRVQGVQQPCHRHACRLLGKVSFT